jgi:hypothetical protein
MDLQLKNRIALVTGSIKCKHVKTCSYRLLHAPTRLNLSIKSAIRVDMLTRCRRVDFPKKVCPSLVGQSEVNFELQTHAFSAY